jgi:hypothetical protein
VAVSVTAAPPAKAKLHVPLVVPAVDVQLMPPGLLVTVPTPAPEPVMVSVCVAGLTTWLTELLLLAVNAPAPA